MIGFASQRDTKGGDRPLGHPIARDHKVQRGQDAPTDIDRCGNRRHIWFHSPHHREVLPLRHVAQEGLASGRRVQRNGSAHPTRVANGLSSFRYVDIQSGIAETFAYRAFLVTHAVLVDALARLRDVTERLINIAQESPLFMGNPERVVHHGAFHQAALAHELDAGAIALAQCAPILISRVKLMNDDTLTGLPRFLAPEGGGRSGTMIVEYVAASAMGDVLAAASPSSIHSTVLSCGVEDDASFAPTALHQLEGAASAYEVMLGCELLVSVRALRLRPPGTVILDGPLKDILSQLDALPAIMDDHDLREELDLAQALVRELGV